MRHVAERKGVMRQRLAQSLLVIGAFYGFFAVTLYHFTGGSTTELLGIRISLTTLTVLITFGLVSGWLLLSRAGIPQEVAFTEGISGQTPIKIAYAFGGASAVYLSLLKIWQHWTFNTDTFDLGLQASVAWNTAHGYLFHDSIRQINYLGDHFSPFYLLLAPVYRLWEDAATLLVIQSIGIGLAAIALYLLSLKQLNRQWPAVAMTILFLSNSYLHRVSAFDFHPIAFAIPIFLWMLYFIECERYAPVIALALLAVTIEETLLPPLVGVGVYICCFHKRFRMIGLLIASLATIYFVLELKVWMPFFLGDRGEGPLNISKVHISRYTNLGGATLDEIVYAVLRNPYIFVREVVVPFEKVVSLGQLFLSVGFLPLLAPRRLLLLVLPISSILVGNFEPGWRFLNHYSSTTLPFLFFCSVHGLHRLLCLLERLPVKHIILRVVSVTKGTCLLFAFFVGHNLLRMPLYVDGWFQRHEGHIEAINRIMRDIPPAASVCATQSFVPHLINRHQVAMFGLYGTDQQCGSEYLLLELTDDIPGVTWPLGEAEYRWAIADVLQSKAYVVLKEHDGVVLLKRSAEYSLTGTGTTGSIPLFTPVESRSRSLIAVIQGTTRYLFTQRDDYRIYVNSRTDNAWSGWSEVPGAGKTPSQPAAVLDGSGALRLYIRGMDNALWVNTKTGNAWSGWSEVPGGGRTARGPVAVLDRGQVRLIVWGLDRRIWTALHTPPSIPVWTLLEGRASHSAAAIIQ